MRYAFLSLLIFSHLFSNEVALQTGHKVSEFEYNRVVRVLENTWFNSSVSKDIKTSSDALRYLIVASSGKNRRTFLSHKSDVIQFLKERGLYNNGVLESTRLIVKNCIKEKDGKYILQSGLKQRLSCKL